MPALTPRPEPSFKCCRCGDRNLDLRKKPVAAASLSPQLTARLRRTGRPSRRAHVRPDHFPGGRCGMTFAGFFARYTSRFGAVNSPATSGAIYELELVLPNDQHPPCLLASSFTFHRCRQRTEQDRHLWPSAGCCC